MVKPKWSKHELQVQEYKQKLDRKEYYITFIHKLKSEQPSRSNKSDLISFCNRKIKNIDKLLYYK